jgi:Uma2 family endonuclease
MAVAQARLTLEEFNQLPEAVPPLEFENGVVTQKVSPKGRHSVLQQELAERINQYGRRARLARAFPELRVTFSGASRVPDISVYGWDRIPVDAHGVIADDFFEPPDVAIEIVSPEQSVNALVRRCIQYIGQGVAPATVPRRTRTVTCASAEVAAPGSCLGTKNLNVAFPSQSSVRRWRLG